MIPVVLTQTGAGTSAWKNADYHRSGFNLNIVCTTSGTVNYGIETTNSNFLGSGTVNAVATSIAAATGAATVNITTPIRGWRINIASGSGTVTAEAIQSGIA
jgi:hypothetical protein